MDKQHSIKLFENKKVRVQWNQEQEKWYFSIIDVIEILTGSSIPRRYWSDLKIKLKEEGFELYEKIVQLKLESSDGKSRNRIVLIQSKIKKDWILYRHIPRCPLNNFVERRVDMNCVAKNI